MSQPDYVRTLVEKVIVLLNNDPLTWQTSEYREKNLVYSPSKLEDLLIEIHNFGSVPDVMLRGMRDNGLRSNVRIDSWFLRRKLVNAAKGVFGRQRQAVAKLCLDTVDTYLSSLEVAGSVGQHRFPHTAFASRKETK